MNTRRVLSRAASRAIEAEIRQLRAETRQLRAEIQKGKEYAQYLDYVLKHQEARMKAQQLYFPLSPSSPSR